MPDLHQAARTGDVAQIEAILAASPSAVDDSSDSWGTPLHIAAEAGQTRACALLLDRGAQIEACCRNLDATPLSYAVKYKHPDVVRLLLERGADPNVSDEDGVTPLLIAAHCGSKLINPPSEPGAEGYVEIVKILLDSGADPNRSSNSGYSPLHAAASFGHLAAVELLIRAGADRNARDIHGTTAAMLAIKKGHARVADKIEPSAR